MIEQQDKVGGFATAFSRPGGFTFDVSLHSTTVGQRDGVFNLISGFPEIADVEFKPHPHLFRAIYPDHDIRVRQRDRHASATAHRSRTSIWPGHGRSPVTDTVR